jgi:hypothetical protein
MTLPYTTQTMTKETASKSAMGFVTEWQQPPDELQAKRNRNAVRDESSEVGKPLPKSVLKTLSGRPETIYPGL